MPLESIAASSEQAALLGVAELLRETLRGQVHLAGPSEELPLSLRLVSLSELETTKKIDGTVLAVGEPTLSEIVSSLAKYPGLGHITSPSFLRLPGAADCLCSAAFAAAKRDCPQGIAMAKSFKGRRATLTDTGARDRRLDKLHQTAHQTGASSRIADQIREIADELVTNALYHGANVLEGRPVDRTKRVQLPQNRACTITYGLLGELFLVKVRDPFGAIDRSRLMGVLQRCAAREFQIDSTQGGAGLGLWRVFQKAALVALTVHSGVYTDFLVGVGVKRQTNPRSRSVHLSFYESRIVK